MSTRSTFTSRLQSADPDDALTRYVAHGFEDVKNFETDLSALRWKDAPLVLTEDSLQ